MALFPAALHLLRFTRNEAQARNVLAQRARHGRVLLGGAPWLLSLEPLQPTDSAAMAVAGQWRVRGEWAGAPFEIEVPASAAQAWIHARFPDLDVPASSEPFAAAALEAALADVFAGLDALQRGPARLDALERAAAPSAGWPAELPHGFALTLTGESGVTRLRLATNPLGLMLMAGLAAHRPAAANALPAEDVPVLLRAEVGVTWLAACAFAGLAVGDTVLVEHPFTAQDGALWLGQEHWGLRVRCEGAQLVVTQAFAPTGLTMTPDTTAAAGAETPVALDGIPLRLAFDLGERTLTLGELQTLQVGQSLDLGRPLSGAVSLRVNGMLVGSGELVEIDGRLGVTITVLAARAESAP